MHFVVFGLTMSSSWGNGHATLWRGLVQALVRRSHTLSFYEKAAPYYASTADGWQPPPGATLHVYQDFESVSTSAHEELRHTDVAIATSFCPDGAAASELMLESPAAVKAFYDLDTPVTLDALRSGAAVPYLPPQGLSGFDIVLSFTGGRALHELQTRLGARAVAPLYGWVDPETHKPSPALDEFRSELTYLGTFAADRQKTLNELFVEPACLLRSRRFVIGGAQYPDDFPWLQNIFFVRHLPPAQHPAFFCSGRATLNVTRQAMARYGFCPSGRLFEAAACGAPILTDCWEGLETFFAPGSEILPVHNAADVVSALSLSDWELQQIASAARARVCESHTAARRALQLEDICEALVAHPIQQELVA